MVDIEPQTKTHRRYHLSNIKKKHEWYLNNKDRMREQKAKIAHEWSLNNRGRKREATKRWRINNKERYLEIQRKSNTKRYRNFGYIPLNEKFPGSVGHHISRDCVVYIPEELHKSIPHKYNDPISMGEINILALEYL